ncbi:MAG TPA: patatin-like phospholipase family protein [Burkholderiales bacterium]|nr:patatin-like phospholipase family protein [Burkholderiales bacterium]
MRKAHWLVLSAAALAVATGCVAYIMLRDTAAERAPRSTQDLMAARRAEDMARASELRELTSRFLSRMAAKPQPASLEILVISGGGDWGAFGAGVLKGWARVKGELARPQFDIVTGVSTGGLIAPFAFLGDEQSIERIVQLYRNPYSDIAVSRSALFFLPNNPSFYVLPGLERQLQATVDQPMVERLAAEEASGRILLVNTTNIDLGDNRAWNLLAAARQALATKDNARLHAIMLASAGIPGVFPARSIGEYLYVDGAITGNILYAGESGGRGGGLLARWKAEHPRAPMPRVRYWVIFNNQLRFPPEIIRNRWPDLINRATIMGTQTSTVNSLRHLYALAELEKLRSGAEVQVRLISVPEEWVPSKPGTFVKEVMNQLADLGEKLGADPASWRSETP